MTLSMEDMIAFKVGYCESMKKSSKKVVLTPYEVKHKDYWAKLVFGSAEYAFMFEVLIGNVDFALEHGYMIAG